MCPRKCLADRIAGQTGKCRTGDEAIVSSYGPHYGEEAPLVGRGGSGTIFFTHCNLECLYCQNYNISQLGDGDRTSAEKIAGIMLHLQENGCHNINLVSPTHVVPFILDAVQIAAAKGLQIPLVYNTGGYDSLETLQLLERVVDIYMPDMKYADAGVAEKLSGIKDYPSVNRAAVKEMHRQVGDLTMDEHGVAVRGLLVRHLVLPGNLAGTEGVVRFLAGEVSPETYLNIMAQYHPDFRAMTVPALSRSITPEEYKEAMECARRYGIRRLDKDFVRGLPTR